MFFLGLLILLFLTIIRPQDFMPFIKGERLVFGVMSTMVIAWILSREKKKLFYVIQDKFFILFLVAVLISTIYAKWLQYSFNTLFWIFKFGVVYYFCINVINNEIKLKIVSWVLVILLSIVGVFGILQYYNYDITSSGMTWSLSKGVWQIKGANIFDNPNDLAYSIVLVVSFASGLFVGGKSIIKKFFGIFLLWISAYCIFLTKSRGGIVALVSCLLFWLYFWIKSGRLRHFLIIFIIFGIVLVIAIQAKGYKEDASSMGRAEAWAAGLSMLRMNPLTGVGWQQFREHYKFDSHSSYVKAAAELGVFGLYAFLGIIYFSMLSLYKISVKNTCKDLRIYYSGFGGYIGSYLLGSMFSSRTYDALFYLCIAMVSILVRIANEESKLNGFEIVDFGMKLWNWKVFAITILVIFSLKIALQIIF